LTKADERRQPNKAAAADGKTAAAVLSVGVTTKVDKINEEVMSDVQHVRNVINAFLSDDDTSVLVLKGGWGVGKTYFWKNYIASRITNMDLNQIAYSYVSLFGLNDIDSTRTKIFKNGIPLKSETEMEAEFDSSVNSQNKLLKFVPAMKKYTKDSIPKLGKLVGMGKDLPYLKEVASIITAVEHGLVKNYLVCFDDLERKGNKLTIRELMGLIDDLVIEKACKIIIVFNEASLTNRNDDRKQFETYREKIVDVEVEFKPTVVENISHVFTNTEPFINFIEEVYSFLNVSNIRILKKTKWALRRIRPNLLNLRPELQEEVVKHLLVFSWAYYNTDTILPLSTVAEKMKNESWMTEMIKPNGSPSAEDKAWGYISNNLGIGSAQYDTFLISLLTEGFIDEKSFNTVLAEKNLQAHANEISQKMHNAWNIYRDSFKDNLGELLDAFIDILDNDIKFLKLYDFSSIIDVLSQYGVGVEDYITTFIRDHEESLATFDFDDDPFGAEIKNSILRARILDVTKLRYRKTLTIDGVAEKISKRKGWNQDDIAFLGSLTVDEIYNWMLSNPTDLKIKIRSGLLFFRNVQGSNESDTKIYKQITKLTEDALRRIAATNPLNHKRVYNGPRFPDNSLKWCLR
jgi:hypothetical protein